MTSLLRAFLWLEIHMGRQYRWSVVLQIVQFMIFLFIFSRLPISEAGFSFSGGLYIHFVLTGIAYQVFYEAILNGPTSRLSELQMTGLLQIVLSGPHPRWKVIFAAGAASILAGVAKSIVILVGGAFLFGFVPENFHFGQMIGALLFTTVLCVSLGLLNVAGSLLWPRVNLTSFFSSLLLGLLSGVFVPIEQLPKVIQVIASANPLRWGLDAFRSSLGIHSNAVPGAWLPALLVLVAIVLISTFAYRRADLALTRENRYQYF